MATIKTIHPATSENRYLARVETAQQGEAGHVLYDGVRLQVIAHLDTVTWLTPGDRVFIEIIDEGAVILGRLRAPTEQPAAVVHIDTEKRLVLNCAGGVILHATDNTIELRKDGTILIDGKTIQSRADGQHRLQGATIELN